MKRYEEWHAYAREDEQQGDEDVPTLPYLIFWIEQVPLPVNSLVHAELLGVVISIFLVVAALPVKRQWIDRILLIYLLRLRQLLENVQLLLATKRVRSFNIPLEPYLSVILYNALFL